MTSNCVRKCVEICELSSAVKGLSVEQLLLMAVEGSSVDEVRVVLDATNWPAFLSEMKMIKSEV